MTSPSPPSPSQSTTTPSSLSQTHTTTATTSPPSLSTLDPSALSSPELIAFCTRLYAAARAGDTPTFAAALPAGLPPNLRNDKGDTLLMLASYHGHEGLVRLLLKWGADPNVLNDRGQSCLAGAVFKKEEGVVRALVEDGMAEGDGGGEGRGKGKKGVIVADPDLGTPSAAQAVGMFRMEGEWGEVFEEARRRIREGRGEGGESGGREDGTKAGREMM